MSDHKNLKNIARLSPEQTVVIGQKPHDWNNASWDQQKVISYNNYQYVPYWNDDHQLVLARRNLEAENVTILEFDHKLSRPDDAHNSTCVGISPIDGRLHLSFDHHNQPLNYMHSKADFLDSPPEELSRDQFSEVGGIFEDGIESQVTYPRFFSDSSGMLYFFYRSGSAGSGDSYLHKHQADGNTWTRVGKVFSGDGQYEGFLGTFDSRNAYLHDLIFDENDRLHASWTYRETGGFNSNHDVHYAYSDDRGTTWMNNDGTQIADLDNADPIRVDDPGIVVYEVPQNYWLINQGTMTLDARRQPHIFTSQSTNQTMEKVNTDNPVSEANRHFVHFWRTPDGTWHREFIDDTDVDIVHYFDEQPNRGDIMFDDRQNLHVYSVMGGTVYAAVATMEEDWTDWQIYRLLDGIEGGSGWKRDKRRWENERVLSFAATRKDDENRWFEVQDYKLVNETTSQKPAISVSVETSSGQPTARVEVTEAVGAQRYDCYRRVANSDDEWSLLASDVGEGTFVHSIEDTALVSGTTYEYRVAAAFEPENERFSDPVRLEAVAGQDR